MGKKKGARKHHDSDEVVRIRSIDAIYRVEELIGHELTYREACKIAKACRTGLGELHEALEGAVGEMHVNTMFGLSAYLDMSVERILGYSEDE